SIELTFERAVFRHIFTARDHELKQHDRFHEVWKLLEGMFKRQEPFDQAFCIIEAIDAQQNLIRAYLFAKRQGPLVHFIGSGKPVEVCKIGADWKHADLDVASLCFEDDSICSFVNAHVGKHALDTLNEVVA